MKAKFYKIVITDSMMDAIHGFSHSIEEVFIPDLNISINITGDDDSKAVTIFRTYPGRYEGAKNSLIDAQTKPAKLIGRFEIEDDFAHELDDYLNRKDSIEKKVIKWW